MTLELAKSVIDAATAEARKRDTTGSFAVVDEGGHLVCLDRITGTFAASANIAIGKARTAALFRKPTRLFEDLIKAGRTSMVALPEFTPLQGGVPIVFEGAVIGAIGVSGAASAAEDEELALIAAAVDGAKSAKASDGSIPVLFFDRQSVAEAFARGVPVFDGDDRRTYRIHASRRDAPGAAEVHLGETDIIYVQDGSATFVTGGTVVDETEPQRGEIRGTSIRDGQTRELRKGDVIVVPRGTPHWFKQVAAPFTYYVVKVRDNAGAMP
jgi:glc operon protein GlcG